MNDSSVFLHMLMIVYVWQLLLIKLTHNNGF